MLEVSGSRPDGVQEKIRKTCVRSLGNMKKKKREERSEGKKRISENTARDSPRQGAIKSSFIHTVSSNYQCLYSIQ